MLRISIRSLAVAAMACAPMGICAAPPPQLERAEVVDFSLPQGMDHRLLPTWQAQFTDARNRVLLKPLEYIVGFTSDKITVPEGFVHDGASIPGWLHSFIRKDGAYSDPAIVHDYLYWEQPCTRLQSDNIMLLAMKENGVSRGMRILIYEGVRLGGAGAWKENAAEKKKSTLPRYIPGEHLSIPSGVSWPDYQRTLYEKGVRDNHRPAMTVGFCARGDSTKVPLDEAPMTLQQIDQ